MRYLVICLLALTVTGCVKLHEEIIDVPIEHTQNDIDIPQPGWDDDNELDFEL